MQQPHKRWEIVLVFQLICGAKVKDMLSLEPPHTHTHTHSARSNCIYHAIDLFMVLALWITICKNGVCMLLTKHAIEIHGRYFSTEIQ